MEKDLLWGYLIHLGCNLWADREAAEWGLDYVSATRYLRCDKKFWDEVVRGLVEAGFNLVVIDLAEGVRYESHPELAVKGSWSPKRLAKELDRMRKLGLEPIPKLNFSSTHDTWLGPYSRCLSTRTYYRVCRDLIREVARLFDKPRFFHLGMDEETAPHQRFYEYVVVRQYELWWFDLYLLCEEVERAGSIPWVWSDYYWHHPEVFIERMPRSVLQSNWYYRSSFSSRIPRVRAFVDLDKHHYRQIPTGSNVTYEVNFPRLVRFCRRRLSEKNLLGFLQTVWRPTLPRYRERHLSAIEIVGKVIRGERR